jgi:hypothetical protein
MKRFKAIEMYTFQLLHMPNLTFQLQETEHLLFLISK